MSAKHTQVYWMTGRSGSGKTSIADAVIEHLTDNHVVRVFDGDIVRREINPHLTFSPEDIKENNRIIVDLCRAAMGECDYIFVPIISPFEESRSYAREILGDGFHLVYVKASLDTVVRRDVKGLYQKALNGEIPNFIGVDPAVPYQEPVHADLVLDADRDDLEASVDQLQSFIQGVSS